MKTTKLTRLSAWVLTFAVLVLAAPTSLAAEKESPTLTSSIRSVVDWFQKLDQTFNEWMLKEMRDQFIRRLDKVSKSLYSLKADKQALVRSIEAKNPDRPRILDKVKDLKQSVADLRSSLKVFGATLR